MPSILANKVHPNDGWWSIASGFVWTTSKVLGSNLTTPINSPPLTPLLRGSIILLKNSNLFLTPIAFWKVLFDDIALFNAFLKSGE